MSAAYRHSLELCKSAAGLPDFSTLPELAAAEAGLGKLQAAHQDGSMRLLQLPFMDEDLAPLNKVADEIRKDASDVVFLGTGGSSLGGQALAQAGGWRVPGIEGFSRGPRLHFFDNLDPDSFKSLLKNLPLAGARFIIISKSGNTAETLVQALLVLERLQKEKLSVSRHVIGLTEPENWKANSLRKLLAPHGVMILEHETGIGGRFSGLTNVGLLPAAIAGLNIAEIRAGARGVMEPIINGANAIDIPPVLAAAVMVAFSSRGVDETVMMAYADKLERFTAWYVQLWAESLGKDGQGTTPIRALGPVDQHSQLQLFLDGPANKIFTIITMASKNRGPRMDADFAHRAGLDEFAGKTVGDLVGAQGQATAETLAKRGRPVRQIHLEKLDERAIGALMMHFFVETIIAATILQVDAFDQPAVEEGKLLAKAYLRQ